MATLGLAILVHTQQHVPVLASSRAINGGSLTCKLAESVGVAFGSTKALSCLFTRTDGRAERYLGNIKRFGIDVNHSQKAQIVWVVFGPGTIGTGAMAGSYDGATVPGAAVLGTGANFLVGGTKGQISLHTAGVEGRLGVNLAGGIAQIALKAAREEGPAAAPTRGLPPCQR
jgi:hypothetical protein